MANERITRLSQTVADQDSTSAENEALFAEKTHLQGELHGAASYISSLEERCLDANKKVLELVTENQTLKEYILDLKQRIAVYIPVKGDEIDLKMAEFINNYPDRKRLKVMFHWESPGVYQFGSKSVIVKLMRDTI